ncbi:MAG: CBS domain-containing protein [Candidatus Woesearchaeota archaeon]
MTNVTHIMDKEFTYIDANDTLASAIGELTREGSVLVFDKERYLGTLTTRKITRSRLNPSESKVKGLITHPPKLHPEDDLHRAARLMIDSDLTMLPVEQGDTIIGTVRTSDVLSVLGQEIDSDLIARDIMSTPVETMPPDGLLSTAANTFQRHDISRLPVIENDKVIGLLSIQSVIQNMLNHNRADIFLLGEHQELQNTHVRNAMERDFATEHPESPLSAIADRMASGARTIIITTEGGADGIITQRDVLEAYLVSEPQEQVLSVGVAVKDDSINANRAREELEGFASKYAEQLGIGTVKATLDKQTEQHKGKPHITTKLRIFTDRVAISANGSGWGEAHSIKSALRKAEKQLMR